VCIYIWYSKISQFCWPTQIKARIWSTLIYVKMANLNKKISILENEIEGYKVDLMNATCPQEKIELRELMKSTSDILTELLKMQNEVTKGTW
jgi:hypothetical protein